MSMDETIKENKEVSKKRLTSVLDKVSDISKKTVEAVQKNAKALSEKNKADNEKRRKEKYNPLFIEEYFSKEFKIPNVITIVDDAVRRNIDVCEGAIGWRQLVNGVEILYLYDEFVKDSKLNFVPVAKCDCVYCVDPFDRAKFIQADQIFKKMNDEKLAELKHVAYCLGAKSCSIELVEEEKNTGTFTSALKSRVGGADFVGNELNTHKQISKTVAYFEGNNNAIKPDLKWFAYDENIKGLIEMRCSKCNAIKVETLEIYEASLSTMSQKTACAIDKIYGISGKASLEKQAMREQNSKLIFEIEF